MRVLLALIVVGALAVAGAALAQAPYAGPLGSNGTLGGFSWSPYAGGFGGSGAAPTPCTGQGQFNYSEACNSVYAGH
jgi:hypothetical protein